MKKKKVTAQEVATLAGVSQSTVSMILNNRSDVSFAPATVQRVWDAAQQLNYQSVPHSSCLGSDKKLIVIITPVLYNPYYTCLSHAIESEAFALGYIPIICNTYRDAAQERSFLELINSSDISGVVYTFMPLCPAEARELAKSIPVVTITDKNELDGLDTVELDSIESGSMIAEHLLELGHKKIAFVSTPLSSDNLPRIRRLEGIKKRLEGTDTQLVVWEYKENSPSIYHDVAHESKIGSRATQELLKDPEITAFIGVNDMVAYGILDALKESGLAVPADYSVCGFDALFVSHYSSIALTTIDHMLEAKGRTAFEILDKHISHVLRPGDSKGIYSIEYRPKLIIGGTTGPARTINKLMR